MEQHPEVAFFAHGTDIHWRTHEPLPDLNTADNSSWHIQSGHDFLLDRCRAPEPTVHLGWFLYGPRRRKQRATIGRRSRTRTAQLHSRRPCWESKEFMARTEAKRHWPRGGLPSPGSMRRWKVSSGTKGSGYTIGPDCVHWTNSALRAGLLVRGEGACARPQGCIQLFQASPSSSIRAFPSFRRLAIWRGLIGAPRRSAIDPSRGR